jgi:putative RNA 2'-phosphotransferase
MYEKESKWVSFVLRHSAEKLGLPIDDQGWVNIQELISFSVKLKYPNVTRTMLEQIVAEDSKGRYSIEGDLIRANQGHSMEKIKIKFLKKVPPTELYHGTSTGDSLIAINKSGIQKMKRHHVHLSDNLATASAVGTRHGKLVIITIDTAHMWADGINFYISDNGVWLTDFVDPKYFKDVSVK